jgi:hypothetical protein
MSNVRVRSVQANSFNGYANTKDMLSAIRNTTDRIPQICPDAQGQAFLGMGSIHFTATLGAPLSPVRTPDSPFRFSVFLFWLTGQVPPP